MDVNDFRDFGKATIDFIADYFENIRERQVLSSVEPGYLKCEMPQEAPTSGEPWQQILQDIDKIIMPGLTHWHSPNFHAYYPTANSFPGIVGELFLSGLGVVSKDWFSNPACIELELKMMDWLGKLINLPEVFLNSSDGPGGGVIQNAASESTLVGLLTSKLKTINETLKTENLTETEIKQKLVAYTSEQSNSSVEKAGLLASVPIRLLQTDNEGCLRGQTLLEAIQKDKSLGFVPCCVIATLGTTGTCSFDKLNEIGPICERFKIWLHVDAAYAGSAFACPEYRYLMNGIEYVDSFTINPHKWMLVNSDCSAMWFKNTKYVEEAFKIKSNNKPSSCSSSNSSMPEIQHWQIPNTRRFRGLKLWFVLRIYGVEGIQKHIRHQISLAKYLEELVKSDERFEVCTVKMGLVCFRLKGKDDTTQKVIDKVTERKNVFIMPYYYQNKLVVRFVVCSRFTEKEDIDYAWKEILEQTQEILPKAKGQKNDYSVTESVTKSDEQISVS